MEWNNGALTLIFIMCLIPIVFVYAILRLLVKKSNTLNSFLQKEKEERFILYFLIEIAIIGLSILIAFGLLSIINLLNGGKGLLG